MKHIAAIVPHPPIMVEAVGKENVQQVCASVQAMNLLAGKVRQFEPDSFVIISPHSPMHDSSFVIKGGSLMSGDLGQFGAPSARVELAADTRLREAIVAASGVENLNLIVTGPGDRENRLDHGVVVPMSFILEAWDCPAVCVSICWDHEAHIGLGRAIRAAADGANKKVAIIASGDLSHRLTQDAPAGYEPEAYKFDEAVKDIVERGALLEIETLSAVLTERAGECGLRSIYLLDGFFEGHELATEVLSYEGPFGVGYLVAYLNDV